MHCFIYKNNFRPIFLFNTDIKVLDIGYYLKIQFFIFILKKYKANIKKLVTNNNFIKNI